MFWSIGGRNRLTPPKSLGKLKTVSKRSREVGKRSREGEDKIQAGIEKILGDKKNI